MNSPGAAARGPSLQHPILWWMETEFIDRFVPSKGQLKIARGDPALNNEKNRARVEPECLLFSTFSRAACSALMHHMEDSLPARKARQPG